MPLAKRLLRFEFLRPVTRMLRDLISRYNSDGGGKMQQMERDLEELCNSSAG